MIGIVIALIEQLIGEITRGVNLKNMIFRLADAADVEYKIDGSRLILPPGTGVLVFTPLTADTAALVESNSVGFMLVPLFPQLFLPERLLGWLLFAARSGL